MLGKLDFTSERKRMSVIVRDPQTNKITLYCKGADSIILSRIAKNGQNSEEISKSKEHLKIFSKEGLRTLCVAKAEIDEDKFREWLSKYQSILKRKNASRSSEEDSAIEEEILKVL